MGADHGAGYLRRSIFRHGVAQRHVRASDRLAGRTVLLAAVCARHIVDECHLA